MHPGWSRGWSRGWCPGSECAFTLFHALALVLAAGVAWWRIGERSARGAAWVLTALAASALPIWLLRFSPEAYRAALVLAGVAVLAPRPTAEIEDPWTMRPAHAMRAARAVTGGVLLGLAVWELGVKGLWLVLVPIVAMPQSMGRERRRVVVGHAALASLAIVVVAAVLHLAPLSRLRSLDPSRLPREARVFTSALPRESGEDFSSLGALVPRSRARPSEVLRAYALRDAFVGRFSGALWWYPCAAVGSVVVLLRRPRAWRLGLMIVAVAGLASHALADPERMAGPIDGAGPAVSASLYPLIVVAGTGVVGLRSLVAAWTLAGALLGEPLTNPLAAVREPALHARSLPYTLVPLDVSRIGRWPGGRTMGSPVGETVLTDVRENVDVVTSACDLVATDSGPTPPCFWTPGVDPAEVLVWSARAAPPPYMVLRAGPVATQVELTFGGSSVQRQLAPAEIARVPIEAPGEGFAVRLDGRDGWAWIVRVRSGRAFQPAQAGVGRDRHWLGVQVGIPDGSD
ncbi:MAG: hypothetical protein IPK07_20865 [Deltaproteobacteria bacterium]|nr:hypothetical protein [Deltaproteobacteria bacterium]